MKFQKHSDHDVRDRSNTIKLYTALVGWIQSVVVNQVCLIQHTKRCLKVFRDDTVTIVTRAKRYCLTPLTPLLFVCSHNYTLEMLC